MKMARIQIQLPVTLKRKLEDLQDKGTSASGFIRWLVEQHFAQYGKKGH